MGYLLTENIMILILVVLQILARLVLSVLGICLIEYRTSSVRVLTFPPKFLVPNLKPSFARLLAVLKLDASSLP